MICIKIIVSWKSKLNLDAGSRITIVEVHTLLQLLVSHAILKDIKDDELCELVFRISRHPEVFELCYDIQISHKIPAMTVLLAVQLEAKVTFKLLQVRAYSQ